MSHKVNSSIVVSKIASVLSPDSFFAFSFVREFWFLTGTLCPLPLPLPNNWMEFPSLYWNSLWWFHGTDSDLWEVLYGIPGRLQFKASWFSQEALLIHISFFWPVSQTWLQWTLITNLWRILTGVQQKDRCLDPWWQTPYLWIYLTWAREKLLSCLRQLFWVLLLSQPNTILNW